MRAAIGVSISAALLCLFACGGGPLPTGTFRGEHSLEVKPGTDPVIANQLRRVVVTIAEDGKATIENGGLPMEGLASRRGDTLAIEVLAVSGINIEKQPPEVPRRLELKIEFEDKLRFGDAVLNRVR
ncbi:hypothetical protein EON82_13145 [bacterium]|nr:MAG: hypothetical protein EON82_13145 [bacterium]